MMCNEMLIENEMYSIFLLLQIWLVSYWYNYGR